MYYGGGGESHGEEGILNEYFIEFKDHLLPLLFNLFNCILDTVVQYILNTVKIY